MSSSGGYEHEEWSGRTDGTPFMQRSLIVIFRYIPLWMCYGMMSVVALFYMIFNRRGYRWAYHFYRTGFKYNRLKAFCYVYVNHFRFGQIIVDRFAKYAGKKFKFDNPDEHLFTSLVERPESFIMLSSHTGNYEMAGYTLVSGSKTINALTYSREAETVMKNRMAQFGLTNIRMILVEPDMSHLFKINDALSAGEVVSMPADRTHGSKRTVSATFLGRPAKFPAGPFMTISQRELPALAIFVMKSGYRTYRVILREVKCSEDVVNDRRKSVASLAQSFADALTEVVTEYPAQWFNYYDFWND